MIRILCVLALAVACVPDAPPPAQSADSHGTQVAHPELPAAQGLAGPGDSTLGFTRIDTSRFDQVGNLIADTAFFLVHLLRNGRHVLQLQRVETADARRLDQRYEEIVAELDVGLLSENEELDYPCRIGGVLDPEVVAIIVPDTAQYFTTIRRAWRASRGSRTFEDLAPNGIDCENDAYGM